jgi:tetratricopeptide (TPR) repeat protein
MAIIKCKKCNKKVSKKAKICPYCGELLESNKVTKKKRWHERTSVTLCVAAGLIFIGLGFIHIITGVVSRYNLPFDITIKKSFGYRETFINARKITSIPYVAARIKYPIGCEVLQRLEYIESGTVFETAMTEQLREAMKIWQMEFEETLNKPEEKWQDQLRGKTVLSDKNSSSSETYNNRGIVAAIEGRYETAISEFTRAFRKDPAYANAYFNRGLVYVAIGQLGPAISDFSQTIEIDPEFTDAYSRRGQLYVSMNQYDQAISDFTKVIEKNPNCNDLYFRRAMVFFAQGQYDNTWKDVHKLQNRGLIIPPGFLNNLNKVSRIENK